jgi:DNA-binding response OmpR family regulator
MERAQDEQTQAPGILVIEDDATVVKLLRMTLERAGYRLDVVGSVAAGRALLQPGSHQMLILDLALPDGNGLDLLRAIRSEMGIECPVLILTSYRQEDSVVQGLENGADDYLTKPFSPRELLARVRKRVQPGAPWHVAPVR